MLTVCFTGLANHILLYVFVGQISGLVVKSHGLLLFNGDTIQKLSNFIRGTGQLGK